jgi:putative transcriptional regulator
MLDTMAGTVRLRVSEILTQRGMTAADLARKAGLNHNTALALMRNAYDRIGMETIARVCDALEVTPGELFFYEKDKEAI